MNTCSAYVRGKSRQRLMFANIATFVRNIFFRTFGSMDQFCFGWPYLIGFNLSDAMINAYSFFEKWLDAHCDLSCYDKVNMPRH